MCHARSAMQGGPVCCTRVINDKWNCCASTLLQSYYVPASIYFLHKYITRMRLLEGEWQCEIGLYPTYSNTSGKYGFSYKHCADPALSLNAGAKEKQSDVNSNNVNSCSLAELGIKIVTLKLKGTIFRSLLLEIHRFAFHARAAQSTAI